MNGEDAPLMLWIEALVATLLMLTITRMTRIKDDTALGLVLFCLFRPTLVVRAAVAQQTLPEERVEGPTCAHGGGVHPPAGSLEGPPAAVAERGEYVFLYPS